MNDYFDPTIGGRGRKLREPMMTTYFDPTALASSSYPLRYATVDSPPLATEPIPSDSPPERGGELVTTTPVIPSQNPEEDLLHGVTGVKMPSERRYKLSKVNEGRDDGYWHKTWASVASNLSKLNAHDLRTTRTYDWHMNAVTQVVKGTVGRDSLIVVHGQAISALNTLREARRSMVGM